MKNKTLTIILSAVLIGCIGVSIYQYQTTVNLKNELSVLTNTKNELTTEIENKTAELNNITSEIEETNNAISELTANVESLTASSKEIQSEIDSFGGKNGDEYKEPTTEEIDVQSQAEAALQRAKERNPEMFKTDSSPAPTQQGNYEHVGTPDSGEYINPDFALDGDYSEGAGAIVY